VTNDRNPDKNSLADNGGKIMSRFVFAKHCTLLGTVAAICFQAASAQGETVFRFNTWLPKLARNSRAAPMAG
jgi:hypothetical protein